MDSIFQMETFGKSMRDAAKEFAASYWDKPRKVRFEKRADGCFFKVTDGIRLYQVVKEPSVAFQKPAVYKIIIAA